MSAIFVDACAHTVLLDNKVTPSEADLLRAIAYDVRLSHPPIFKSSAWYFQTETIFFQAKLV
ncbi:hypothetical protein [Nostoc sp.]|uniref:hypothetical protein n=1 Tax=Nostoc sp. TaxID=1180 RepID=UPI002FF46C08